MPRCPSMQKSIGNRCISSEPLSIWAVFPCPRIVSKSASTMRCPLIDTSAPSEWEVGAPPERFTQTLPIVSFAIVSAACTARLIEISLVSISTIAPPLTPSLALCPMPKTLNLGRSLLPLWRLTFSTRAIKQHVLVEPMSSAANRSPFCLIILFLTYFRPMSVRYFFLSPCLEMICFFLFL